MGLRKWSMHSIKKWLPLVPHRRRLFAYHINAGENTIWNFSLKNFKLLAHIISTIQSNILAWSYSSSIVAHICRSRNKLAYNLENYALDSRSPPLDVKWSLKYALDSVRLKLFWDSTSPRRMASDGGGRGWK